MTIKNWPHEKFDRYFASGSNHAGEIRGLALSGWNIGVAVDALDKAGAAIAELELLAGGYTKIFVDSGAFGEVKFDVKEGRFVDVRPITDEEWERRLAVYDRLAHALGSQLYIVAPDKVGDQVQTLCRLERYAERIKSLAIETGCNVIVPIQNGEVSAIEFDRAVREIFESCEVEGEFNFVRGIPSKKGATTAKQLREYCEELLWDDHETDSGLEATELRFHLLGLAPYSDRFEEIRGAIPSWAADVTCDSVRITALVGQTNGRGGSPRDLTRRRNELLAARPELAADATTVKFRIVQDHFCQENSELLAASVAAGWFDPELVEAVEEIAAVEEAA